MDKRERKQKFASIHYEARIKAKKSQEYMALELDVTKKTVQNWEKGISSPSFFQSLEWFRVLKINPFPLYLSLIYPNKIEGIKPSDSDEKIEDAFNVLIQNISIKDKRALLYLYHGEHGSAPHSVIQLLLAHLHCPMPFRTTTAALVAHEYELNKSLGTIICPDNIQPDMDNLKGAILKATESAINNESGYSSINKEDAD